MLQSSLEVFSKEKVLRHFNFSKLETNLTPIQQTALKELNDQELEKLENVIKNLSNEDKGVIEIEKEITAHFHDHIIQCIEEIYFPNRDEYKGKKSMYQSTYKSRYTELLDQLSLEKSYQLKQVIIHLKKSSENNDMGNKWFFIHEILKNSPFMIKADELVALLSLFLEKEGHYLFFNTYKLIELQEVSHVMLVRDIIQKLLQLGLLPVAQDKKTKVCQRLGWVLHQSQPNTEAEYLNPFRPQEELSLISSFLDSCLKLKELFYGGRYIQRIFSNLLGMGYSVEKSINFFDQRIQEIAKKKEITAEKVIDWDPIRKELDSEISKLIKRVKRTRLLSEPDTDFKKRIRF